MEKMLCISSVFGMGGGGVEPEGHEPKETLLLFPGSMMVAWWRELVKLGPSRRRSPVRSSKAPPNDDDGG